MSWEENAVSAIAASAVTGIGAAYLAWEKRQSKIVDVEAKAGHEEREITQGFALRAEERAARAEERIRELEHEARSLATQCATAIVERDVARAELVEKDAEIEAQKLGRIAAEELAKSLTGSMMMAQQLLDRQREEVVAKTASEAAALKREAEAKAATEELRQQYDAFVKRVMEGTDA